MKEINLNLLNTYTCQLCDKNFKTKIDYIIIQGYAPLCSHKCLFKFIYRILNKYDEKELYIMACQLDIDKKTIEDKRKLIFSLTKFFGKYGLSRINHTATSDNDKNTATNEVGNKSATNTATRHPLYKGCRCVALCLKPYILSGGKFI